MDFNEVSSTRLGSTGTFQIHSILSQDSVIFVSLKYTIFEFCIDFPNITVSEKCSMDNSLESTDFLLFPLPFTSVNHCYLSSTELP